MLLWRRGGLRGWGGFVGVGFDVFLNMAFWLRGVFGIGVGYGFGVHSSVFGTFIFHS